MKAKKHYFCNIFFQVQGNSLEKQNFDKSEGSAITHNKSNNQLQKVLLLSFILTLRQ